MSNNGKENLPVVEPENRTEEEKTLNPETSGNLYITFLRGGWHIRGEGENDRTIRLPVRNREEAKESASRIAKMLGRSLVEPENRIAEMLGRSLVEPENRIEEAKTLDPETQDNLYITFSCGGWHIWGEGKNDRIIRLPVRNRKEATESASRIAEILGRSFGGRKRTAKQLKRKAA